MAPTAVLEPGQETRDKTALAPRWKVIVHDDPVTTFAFVIDVMRTVFAKSPAEARRITQETHDTGSALVEVTSFAQAELHCEQVRSLARTRGFPLALSMEPAD